VLICHEAAYIERLSGAELCCRPSRRSCSSASACLPAEMVGVPPMCGAPLVGLLEGALYAQPGALTSTGVPAVINI